MSDWDFLHDMHDRGFSPAEIADAAAVGYAQCAKAQLSTFVGGRERQGYALADMFFSPVELASRISHDMTLARALTPLQATRWPQRHGVATGPRVWDQPCTQQTLADASEAPQL